VRPCFNIPLRLMPGAPSWFSRLSMHVEADLHCMTQRRCRLIGPRVRCRSRARVAAAFRGGTPRRCTHAENTPSHFLRRSLAAPSLLAREGTDDVNDGDGVVRHWEARIREVVEGQVTGIHFLFAQDAHQEFRRKLVGLGSQAHAYHDGPRRQRRAVPASGRSLVPLPAELATYARTVENRGLAIAARRSSTLAADGGGLRRPWCCGVWPVDRR